MRSISSLSGIFPTLTTPFVKHKVDFARLKSNVEKYNELDLAGYKILGGKAEYTGLTHEEAIGIARAVVSANNKKRLIIAGAERKSAEASLEFIREIADLGVDIASIISPYIYNMADNDLLTYYMKIADKSPIPVLIYIPPAYLTKKEIPMAIIAELSRHENIIGLKNSSDREIREFKASVDPSSGFCFLGGKVGYMLRDFEQGAIGAILSVANYWPQDCIDIYRLIMEKRGEEALNRCLNVHDSCRLGAAAYGVAGVKYAMDLAGYFGGEPRLPLQPLTEKQKQKIKESFIMTNNRYVE